MSRPDPERQAAALAYTFGQYAPRVVAKGQGPTAEAILTLAREHGVYVHESAEMLALLMNVQEDDFIPPELYRAVAELLAWLYWLEQGAPEGPALECGEDDHD